MSATCGSVSVISPSSCAEGSTIALSIVTSARSTVEPSEWIIMAAERPRAVACAVRNFWNRSRSWSNIGLARPRSKAMAKISPRIAWACSLT